MDTTNAKFDFSNEEKFALKWFTANGYTGRIVKQYIGKTVFQVSKDGMTKKFELMQGFKFRNIEKYMEQYRKVWEMILTVERRCKR